jgi:hypothetical protein
MTAIRPIETHYNGYRFRSRLEARYAVFFDALGLKYRYEPEGYALGAVGWYLPDFQICFPAVPLAGGAMDAVWIEIKPQPPSALEITRAQALAAHTGQIVQIYQDLPNPHDVLDGSTQVLHFYPRSQPEVHYEWVPLYESLLMLTYWRPGSMAQYGYHECARAFRLALCVLD